MFRARRRQVRFKMRAQRLEIAPDDLYLLCETDMDLVLSAAQEAQPAVLVIDSIQTVFTADLSSVPGQRRTST